MGLFILIALYLLKILKNEYDTEKKISFKKFILITPLVVYLIDAMLNFPVARPLMQSSLAIYLGLILATYLRKKKLKENIFSNIKFTWFMLGVSLILLIPGIIIHIISFKSLKQQGRLLYEFNNAKYTYTRAELDQISHNFPNLTETAMPIKAMKARYYWLAGNKRGSFKNGSFRFTRQPKIHFADNLKAQFF